jgi:galactonate dehydratase
LIEPLLPYWFEEPVDGVQISALSEIREKTGLRIVTGEKQYEVAYFKSILTANAADILNPDIAGVGGLLDIMEIAAMAHDHGVKISPHCWNSMTVAAAAMFHVCASIPNAEMAEIYPEYISYGTQFASVGFSLDGAQAKLSDKPGLGVDVNGQALSKCATHYQTSDLT